MNILQKIAYMNIITGLDGMIVAATGLLLMGLTLEWYIVLPPGLLVFYLYTQNRLSELKQDTTTYFQRAGYLNKHKKILKKVSIFLITMCFLIILLKNNLETIIVYLIILFIGIIYNLPILPNKIAKIINAKRLKDIPMLKPVFPAISWAILGSYLPASYYKHFKITTFVVFLFLFLKAMININIFDLRDAEGDKKNKINTIPVVIGEQKTIIFLHILNIFSVLTLIIGYAYNFLYKNALLLCLSFFYGVYIIEKSRDKKNIKYLCDVVVDSEAILWLILSYFGLFI